MMLNSTSTLASWAATPLFNCWRTFSAYQSWYLSAKKYLALLFSEMLKKICVIVWDVYRDDIILFQQIIYSTRCLPFKHIKYQQRFCILR